MKALNLEQMEQMQGGSCTGAIAQAIFVGAILTTTTGGFGIFLAVTGAVAMADNVSEQCLGGSVL